MTATITKMMTFRSERISSPGMIWPPMKVWSRLPTKPFGIAVAGWWNRMFRNGMSSAIAKPSSSAAKRFATTVIAMRQVCGRRYGRSRL